MNENKTIDNSRKALSYHKTIKRFGNFFPKVKAKYIKKLKEIGFDYFELNDNQSFIRRERKNG